jgi:hypothetical protein
MSLDAYGTQLYKFSREYLTDKKIVINHNILEYVCIYYKCCVKNCCEKCELYVKLKKYFDIRTCSMIIQLINALSLGDDGIAFTELKVYLDSLKYAKTKIVE